MSPRFNAAITTVNSKVAMGATRTRSGATTAHDVAATGGP
jgi:hypothetical protein